MAQTKLSAQLEPLLLFDGIHGIHNFTRIWQFAKTLGCPVEQDQDDFVGCADECIEWLNANMVEGGQIEWHDCDLFLMPENWNTENA